MERRLQNLTFMWRPYVFSWIYFCSAGEHQGGLPCHTLDQAVLSGINRGLQRGPSRSLRGTTASWRCLQDFRDSVRVEWSQHLEEDCAYVLKQLVIQLQKKGPLEVPCGSKLEELFRELRFMTRDKEVKLRPQASHLFSCRDAITDTHLSLSTLQSCYNCIVNRVEPVEQPLIQDQLQDLNQGLSGLQSRSWRSEGLLEEVQRHKDKVLSFYQTVTEACCHEPDH